MKPVVTWILLADARTARILQNLGPGKGVIPTREPVLRAPPPVDYADMPGVAQNSADQSRSAMERRDPQDLAEQTFAKMLADHLAAALAEEKFARLIIAAAPHFLGALRAEITDAVQAALLAQIDKDLVKLPLDALPKHLESVIAV